MKEFYNYKCNKLGHVKNLIFSKEQSKPVNKNQFKVLIYAIGLNYIDILMIKGKYQFKNNLPFIPGIEACGRIIEENCNMPEAVGKKVIIISKGGCFSEEVIADKNDVIFIDNNINTLAASGYYIPFITSYVTLIEIAKAKKGDVLIITGASGGIGSCAIVIAKQLGMKVISLVENVKKIDFVKKLGSSSHLIIGKDIKKAVMKITHKKGANIIMDISGLQNKYNLMSLLEWGGRYCIVGFIKKNIAMLPTNYLLIKGLKVYGIRAGEYMKRYQKRKILILKDFNKFLKKNKTLYKSYEVVDFSSIKENLNKIEKRKSLGKIIVKTKYYRSE
mgnify:CR=1 FL=1